MKNIFGLLAFSIFIFGINSCKKAENKDFFEGGTAPSLSASTSAVTLEPGLEANTAIALTWTNPGYMFTTGVSSQDVTYSLEMDTLGANFSSTKKVTTVIAKELTKSYTVGELNAILGNTMLLQLNPRRNYTLQMRVISSIGSTVKLASNAISFTAKPFSPPPKVTPPASGDLYIVGDATPGGWPPLSNDPLVEKFTKISATYYQLTIHLNADKEFKFVEIPGQWVQQWSVKTEQTSGDPATLNADLYFNGANCRAPSATGNYKITVDFQLGKYTMVKQ
jgi:starch-binding outer membrane protein SusE/F